MQEFLAKISEMVANAPAYQQMALVFFGGLLTAANPCVLVAAPLVIGFAGGTEEGRHHPMLLSGVFVLGLCASFTAMGIVAAMTGSLLGDIGWGWKALLGLVFLAIGLSLLGLYNLPKISHGHLSRFQGAGLVGAFFLGALTGTISAPCATPALAAVLTIVVMQKKIFWGGVLLFTYAVGHSVLLFAAGASSGWASKYAETKMSKFLGRWMPKFMGAMLTVAAVWIIWGAWQSRLA